VTDEIKIAPAGTLFQRVVTVAAAREYVFVIIMIK